MLLTLGALVVALVFGISTASVESSLGPHEARYDVTTDDTITIDLGPLGTLRIDSPLPLTLGVHVTVQEIPASVTQLSQAKTLEALSGDLQSYLQFFSGPEATVQDVARALVVDAAVRAAARVRALVGAWWLLRMLVGAARWQELRARAEPHRRAARRGRRRGPGQRVRAHVERGLRGPAASPRTRRRRCSTARRSRAPRSPAASAV